MFRGGIRGSVMKRVFVITLVGWLLFSNRSLAQNKMVADPPELMAAVNSARQLSSEQTANIFNIALAGARGRYFEWFVAQQTASGRYAQIVLVTDCYALNICNSFPNRHIVLSAVCDTGCDAKWLPPQQDYTWATIERKHHGFRLLTKDAERKAVWTYWNITSVAADDFKASSEVHRNAEVPVQAQISTTRLVYDARVDKTYDSPTDYAAWVHETEGGYSFSFLIGCERRLPDCRKLEVGALFHMQIMGS